MNKRLYNALVTTTSNGTIAYELRFAYHPTVSEVLRDLQYQIKEKEALTLLEDLIHYVHVGGQEKELFNETTIFHYAKNGSWLRIYCPLFSSSKIET